MDKLQLATGVLIFGALITVLAFMVLFVRKQGFGVNSIRIIGIIIVATLAVVIVLSEVPNIEPAMTILGAIAGYLFGFSEKKASSE